MTLKEDLGFEIVNGIDDPELLAEISGEETSDGKGDDEDGIHE